MTLLQTYYKEQLLKIADNIEDIEITLIDKDYNRVTIMRYGDLYPDKFIEGLSKDVNKVIKKRMLKHGFIKE